MMKEIIAWDKRLKQEVSKGNKDEAHIAVCYLIKYFREMAEVAKNAVPLERVKINTQLSRYERIEAEIRVAGLTNFVREQIGLGEGFPDFIDTSSAGTEGWVSKLFKQLNRSVVAIHTRGSIVGSSGSGFVVGSNYILTNEHVVTVQRGGKSYEDIFFTFYKDAKACKMKVLAKCKKTDVALCEFDSEEAKNAKSVKFIADYDKLQPGDPVFNVGNPLSEGLSPGEGVIKYLKDSAGALVYNALANPGDSGGGVFNKQGELIGQTKTRTLQSGGQPIFGFSNATPAPQLLELIRKWERELHIKVLPDKP